MIKNNAKYNFHKDIKNSKEPLPKDVNEFVREKLKGAIENIAPLKEGLQYIEDNKVYSGKNRPHMLINKKDGSIEAMFDTYSGVIRECTTFRHRETSNGELRFSVSDNFRNKTVSFFNEDNGEKNATNTV